MCGTLGLILDVVCQSEDGLVEFLYILPFLPYALETPFQQSPGNIPREACFQDSYLGLDLRLKARHSGLVISNPPRHCYALVA